MEILTIMASFYSLPSSIQTAYLSPSLDIKLTDYLGCTII